MPVIVTFDVPVTDKAAFEKHMTVTTTPAAAGHLALAQRHRGALAARRRTGRPAPTSTSTSTSTASPPATASTARRSREVDFQVGDANINKVDAQTHQMKVFTNGKLLRTIPITTGKQPAFTTRSGIKVIIEKFDAKRMNSETVGIAGDTRGLRHRRRPVRHAGDLLR